MTGHILKLIMGFFYITLIVTQLFLTIKGDNWTHT